MENVGTCFHESVFTFALNGNVFVDSKFCQNQGTEKQTWPDERCDYRAVHK